MRRWHFVDSHRSHYRPLSKERKEVRLLHVFPGQGSDPIWSSFEYVSLAAESMPLRRYTTVSYCWGDSRASEFILVNGYIISIPLSAARVIRRFRQKDLTCTFWVDAVCIDQSNAEEKSWQVALMESIYMMSTFNFIYLGDGGSCDVEQTVKIVENFNAQFQEETRELASRKEGYNERREEFYKRWKSLLLASDGPLNALFSVFALPWFQRMWVVQEVALAPRNLCFWGNKMWSFDVMLFFPTLATTLGVRSLPEVFGTDTSSKTFLDFTTRLLYKIRSRSNRPGHPGRLSKDHTSFMTIRWFTQSLRATEPRDFVFALLGIYRQMNDISEIPKWLEPNYLKPVAEVYRDATRHILEEQSSGSADVQVTSLQSIAHRSTEDITTDGMTSWALRFGRIFDPKKDCVPFSKGHGSEAKDKICIRPPLDLDILTVKGFVVAQITGTVKLQILEQALWLGDSNKAREIMRFLRSYLRTPSDELDIVERRYAIASRVMTAGQYEPTATRLKDNSSSHKTAALKALMHRIEETGLVPPQPAALPADASPEVVDCSNFFNLFQTTGTNRSLLVTDNGYLGLGPKVTQPSDILAVIHGETFALVLRPIDHEFQFLGGAYVDEIVNTESFETTCTPTWIDIR